MYLRFLVLTLLALISMGTLAQGFDENYEVLQGDLDEDGDLDLYIRQKPQVVLIHGDIITPIVLPAYVHDFVLENISNGDFNILNSLNDNQKKLVSGWPQSSSKIILGDFNVDGIVDAFIDIAEEFTNHEDMIVYAAENADASPAAYKKIDEEFRQFFLELYNWVANPNYFEENAPLVRRQIGTTTEFEFRYATPYVCNLYSCRQEMIGWVYCPSGGLCNLIPECLQYYCSSDGFGGVSYQYTVAVEVPVYGMVPDYSGFNQDALVLSQGTLKSIQATGEIIAGSSDAQDIIDKLEYYLGAVFMGGVLENSGEKLQVENDIPDSVLGKFRFGALMSSISQSLTSSLNDGEQSRLIVPQLKELNRLIEEVSKVLEAALENKEYSAAAYANGVVDGALSVPNAISRAYIVVGGDSQGLNGQERYEQFWIRVNLMDQELNRVASDDAYREKITELVRENMQEAASLLSGEQISYALGRLTGRLGTSRALSGYGKIVAVSGDYYYAVARAGAGIVTLPEWISFGEYIDSLNNQ